MRKSIWINILLVLFSTAIALIIAEIALRKVLFGQNENYDFLREPSYYALYYKGPNEDYFNDDFWRLNYLFGKSFELTDPHPLLGWTGLFDRKTYAHWHANNDKGKRPTLLYGDSFAMCEHTEDCFEDILNNDSVYAKNNYLYNYGVGGYGVDQIYLLFNETVDKYKNPFVIFSVLTTDLDRSVLRVRDAQKPYFEVSNDSLNLKGTPITQNSKEYFKNNPPQINSYILNWTYNALIKGKFSSESKREVYEENIRLVNTKILEKVFQKLKSLNTDFVFLIFQPAWHSPDWRLEFLKEICEKNDIPYILDIDVRNKAVNNLGLQNEDFYIPSDGHPTSLANRLVADELKKLIVQDSLSQ